LKKIIYFLNYRLEYIPSKITIQSFIYDKNIYNCSLAIVKNDENFVEGFIVRVSEGIKKGDKVYNFINKGFAEQDKKSSICFLRQVNIGENIFNISNKPKSCGNFAKASGVYGQVVKKDKDNVFIKIPSSKIVKFKNECVAQLGKVNELKKVKKKAGDNRILGFKSKVRGVAINPVDHPHGGGESKGHVGRHPVSPWGKKIKK